MEVEEMTEEAAEDKQTPASTPNKVEGPIPTLPKK